MSPLTAVSPETFLGALAIGAVATAARFGLLTLVCALIRKVL